MSESDVVKEVISILPVSLFIVAFVVSAPATYATSAANCTPIDCNMHGVTIDIGSLGANPCNGEPSTSDAFVTGNFQAHGSADGAHTTMTLTGQITVAQDNGVVFTGHITSWNGGNINNKAAETSGTANFDLFGSDGSSYHINANSHITLTPGGVITVSFNKLSCH